MEETGGAHTPTARRGRDGMLSKRPDYFGTACLYAANSRRVDLRRADATLDVRPQLPLDRTGL